MQLTDKDKRTLKTIQAVKKNPLLRRMLPELDRSLGKTPASTATGKPFGGVPGIKLVNERVTIQSSIFDSVCTWLVGLVFLCLSAACVWVGYLSRASAVEVTVIMSFSAFVLMVTIAIWSTSKWVAITFDVKRRHFEYTAIWFPFVKRRSGVFGDVASIFADARGLKIVFRDQHKKDEVLRLWETSSNQGMLWIRAMDYDQCIADLEAVLDMPLDAAVLAQYPFRNPYLARNDDEAVVFIKPRLSRIIAGVSSKAVSIAALIVGGGLSFASWKHIHISISPSFNLPGLILTALSVWLLNVAGPEDRDF